MAARRSGLGRGLDSLIPEKGKDVSEPKKTKAPKTAVKAEPEKTKTKRTSKKQSEDDVTVTAAKTAAKKTEEKPAAQKQPAVKQAVQKQSAQKQANHEGDVVRVRISLIEPNRQQPRKDFDKDRLAELAESIKQYGVISPLLVQKADDHYEIIAGERRWRAAQIAGLKEVPVIIREYSAQQAVEVSLIENIQREDLNPIEEAKAYVRLMDEFTLTQEQIAGRVAKSRSAVTNAMRLLRLPDEVQSMLVFGELSEGHARALLGLPDGALQTEAARKVVSEGLSVRETEKLVKKITHPAVVRTRKAVNPAYELIFREFEQQLRTALGTKVSIVSGRKGRGKIEIEYYSDAELERLLTLLSETGEGEV